MIILGIDPGTATIGVGVIECDGLKLISKYFGWIETSKDDGAGKRLAQIHREMRKIIKTYKPDVWLSKGSFLSLITKQPWLSRFAMPRKISLLKMTK